MYLSSRNTMNSGSSFTSALTAGCALRYRLLRILVQLHNEVVVMAISPINLIAQAPRLVYVIRMNFGQTREPQRIVVESCDKSQLFPPEEMRKCRYILKRRIKRASKNIIHLISYIRFYCNDYCPIRYSKIKNCDITEYIFKLISP